MKIHRNLEKVYNLGNPYWDSSYKEGLLELRINTDSKGYENLKNHKFINFCSCSYLGINRDRLVLKCAKKAINQTKMIVYPTSRCRIANSLLEKTENNLKELFKTEVILTASCASATLGSLPMIASGLLGPRPDIIVFDKFAHFSLAFLKPICADETEVTVINHNDMESLKKICQENKNVLYVADGAYSMGGTTPIEDLLDLNKKFNLSLFFDDSHSLSVYGNSGEGFIKSYIEGELPENIFIVSSLGKAFGASGGILMLNGKHKKTLFDRYGGPMSWSQSVNHAGLGAINGSIKIHKSTKLKKLQDKLMKNLDYFDSRIKSKNVGSLTPIRLVNIPYDKDVVKYAKKLFEEGYYVSPVSFPIVKRGEQGLRIMPRADISKKALKKFCDKLEKIIK